jgi:adenylylsulfate kinase
MDKPRAWNKKNIKKYLEIYIKSEIKKIILKKKKRIYQQGKNLVGLSIKPEFPKKPDIIIKNDFFNRLSINVMI